MVAEIWAYGNVAICRPGDGLQLENSSRKWTSLDTSNLALQFYLHSVEEEIRLTAQVSLIA